MENCELSISVGDLIGIPRVSLRGSIASWHDQAISGVLAAFRDDGNTSMVLDIAGLSFAGIDGATSFISVLRSLGPQMCVHVVGSGQPAAILRKADLGPNVKLYSSTDEIAEYLSASDDCLTSRWMAIDSQDSQLPLAA